MLHGSQKKAPRKCAWNYPSLAIFQVCMKLSILGHFSSVQLTGTNEWFPATNSHAYRLIHLCAESDAAFGHCQAQTKFLSPRIHGASYTRLPDCGWLLALITNGDIVYEWTQYKPLSNPWIILCAQLRWTIADGAVQPKLSSACSMHASTRRWEIWRSSWWWLGTPNLG